MKRSIALGLLALTLAACGANPPAAVPTIKVGNVTLATDSAMIDKGSGRPAEGQVAPDFSYTLADGSRHALSELRGKRVLLNFWATWCTPCREEMPEFQQTAKANGDSLVVLAVNRNESPDVIATFGNEIGVTFALIANIAGDIGDRYGATSLPITYFINSDGTISSKQLGALSPTLLAKHLGNLR